MAGRTAVPEELKALIRALDADVRDLAGKYHRSRVESVVLACVVAGMLVLGALYWVSQVDRNDYVNGQIHDLACAIIAPNPDTIPAVKAKRAQYHCPPYNPAVARRYRPTATATRTLPAPRPRTSTSTRVVPVPQPARTVVVPGPVRTVTRTVVVCRMPNGRNCR